MKLRDLFPMDQEFSPAVNICGNLIIVFIYYYALSGFAQASILFSRLVLGK